MFNDQNLNYITLDLDLLLSGKDSATWRMTLTAVHVKVYRVCQETRTTCKTLNFDGGKPQTIVSAIKLIMIQGVKFMAEAIVYSFILFSLRHKV